MDVKKIVLGVIVITIFVTKLTLNTVYSLEKEEVITVAPGLVLDSAVWGGPPGSISGSLYFYLKNTGDEPAIIKGIRINNKGIKELMDKGIVSWYRMRPEVLPKGEIGELQIRFKSLFPENIQLFLADFKSLGSLTIEIEPKKGNILKNKVNLSSPIQINFIGFNQNLDKLYLYLQNNEKAKTYNLTKIFLNGKEVTKEASFVEKELKDTILPVEVNLSRPLSKGEPAVITVKTKEGIAAGLTLSAFPSEFPIQVTLLGNQLRSDCVEDIANHCATSIGTCGPSDEHYVRANALGLKMLPYSGIGGGWKDQYISSQYPEVSGLWWDEVDTPNAYNLYQSLKSSEEQRKKLNFPVISMFNIINPWDGTLLEMPEAVCHEHGIEPEAIGLRMWDRPFSQREYRLSRRPFWPYMRNGEFGLLIDRASNKIVGRSHRTQRCIEPAEQRYIIYRCLMQGAKGVLYWNYGAGKCESNDWMDPTLKYAVLRLSLGGIPPGTDTVYGYKIPADVIANLKKIWDEIGRINAELRVIGPLVAVSDVCDNLASIKAVTPSKSINGGPTAFVTTLLCGKDTLILLILNNNIQSTWNSSQTAGISSYQPINLSVDLKVPSWLTPPADIFTVDYQGLTRLSVEKKAVIEFNFNNLATTKVIVVTKDTKLYNKMETTVKQMQGKLRSCKIIK